MGGCGSGRWNWGGARQTTEAWLGLDVRELARAGALRLGAISESFWTRAGLPVASIRIESHEQTVVLASSMRQGRDGDWDPVREIIAVTTTPCQYGGTRPWFRCPGCGTRRAILYGGDGRFRCRQCRDLAYPSSREDVIARSHRRRHHLRDRLGADPQSWAIPSRPPRMHRRTYARLVRQIMATEQQALVLATPRIETLKQSIDQFSEWRRDA